MMLKGWAKTDELWRNAWRVIEHLQVPIMTLSLLRDDDG